MRCYALVSIKEIFITDMGEPMYYILVFREGDLKITVIQFGVSSFSGVIWGGLHPSSDVTTAKSFKGG